MVVLVNRYFTPFAVVLVGTGLALSQPKGWVGPVCIGLLVFSSMFNLATARQARVSGQASRRASYVRLVTNLAVNVGLVYMLGGYWTPTWLLFVLTPVATAVYSSRERTTAVSCAVAGLLLGTQVMRGYNAPVDWGQAVMEAAFIIFLSHFVNELADMARASERT